MSDVFTSSFLNILMQNIIPSPGHSPKSHKNAPAFRSQTSDRPSRRMRFHLHESDSAPPSTCVLPFCNCPHLRISPERKYTHSRIARSNNADTCLPGIFVSQTSIRPNAGWRLRSYDNPAEIPGTHPILPIAPLPPDGTSPLSSGDTTHTYKSPQEPQYSVRNLLHAQDNFFRRK